MSLLNWLRGLFSGGPCYVKISRDCLSVENTATQSKFSDNPLVSISNSPKNRILGVGSNAPNQNATLINPFDHPRLIIHDFQVAEKLLRYTFRQVAKYHFISPSPIAVLQVNEKLEGGLTTIEKRALLEAVYGAGAREVYFWSGPELTVRQLQDGLYKSGESRPATLNFKLKDDA